MNTAHVHKILLCTLIAQKVSYAGQTLKSELNVHRLG